MPNRVVFCQLFTKSKEVRDEVSLPPQTLREYMGTELIL
jgi:hypothetical protein